MKNLIMTNYLISSRHEHYGTAIIINILGYFFTFALLIPESHTWYWNSHCSDEKK